MAGLFGRSVLPVRLGQDGEVITTDHTHEKIHDGRLWFTKGVLPLTQAADTDVYFMFRTNGVCRVHANASLDSNIEVSAVIYEGATVSADGTPIATFNANRSSTNPPHLEAFANPTVTDEGTQIWEARTGTGKQPTGVGGGLGLPEVLVKAETVYLWKITNLVVANTDYVDYLFWWYEDCHNEEEEMA
jgi:hypothetical protein